VLQCTTYMIAFRTYSVMTRLAAAGLVILHLLAGLTTIVAHSPIDDGARTEVVATAAAAPAAQHDDLSCAVCLFAATRAQPAPSSDLLVSIALAGQVNEPDILTLPHSFFQFRSAARAPPSVLS
jgi:hypothetical protein